MIIRSVIHLSKAFGCFLFSLLFIQLGSAESKENSEKKEGIHTSSEVEIPAKRNLERAMKLMDASVSHYFTEENGELKLARYYNPYTQNVSEETGSIWMYTASIEAVNAILKSLEIQKDKGDEDLYHKNFDKYSALIKKLYDNMDFYLGTYTLTSYTQTKQWDIYAVDRVGKKGRANVEGKLNVYDDQMWLIRELLQTYKLTGDEAYLEKAEYLTSYVIDGWDSTLDKEGKEHGGITWGPGYVTKHACSNGPIISPLVWLSELYKDKPDKITYKYISSKDQQTRKDSTQTKRDFYLTFAKKVYSWQKENLLLTEGVYDDMLGGCGACEILYETVNGEKYRKNTPLNGSAGPPITYNSGSMLSGADDLYHFTEDQRYLEDAIELSEKSFNHFAKLDQQVSGYYSFNFDGFNNWFNGVLLRSYVQLYPKHTEVINYINSFQRNLDYSYDNFLRQGMLPSDLLGGWNSKASKNDVEALAAFSIAAQYAVLSEILE